ncbi:gp53-like domain-containing protein [Sphingomonas sp. Leaf242]|uniref:gp53-like domain-containing protein n=1 Tax=Sphingomonas sp. Leaf242 TaxID=1736304 RepID=UPI0007125E82|nr:hypothetical protein [Sphingomonas sp. Leaf242]KQO07860.1 hypothetical protein ASF09_07825 [Sphingomonas sp. Leaf242]
MPLTLTFTNAGLARFTAAQLGNGADLRVSAIGLTDNAIVVAPTLTALPGEFRRIATVSGAQVGDNVVHLIVRDDEAVTYGFRGFGLYLSDGTLFAVYGQADRIMQKAVGASNMLAVDIAFPAANVAAVTFGDTNFLNPPATSTTKGVVELATDAETIDGVDTSRAVTPMGLKARLADILVTLANVVPFGRRIDTTGLATGGRTLDDDITIDVPRATAEEADAGELTTKALTPSSLANILVTLANVVPFGRRINTLGLATGGRTMDADITIDVPRATAEEADAGELTTKALTPSSLVNIIASILARVPLARRVDTAGLAIGGNALTTDITISVPAATAGQLLAGSAGNVAATPAALAAAGVVYLVEVKSEGASRYRRFADGSVEMTGVSALPVSEAAFTLNFPWPFPTVCDGIFATIINSGQSNDGQSTVQEVSLGAASAQLYAQNHKSPTADAAGGFRWFARGH